MHLLYTDSAALLVSSPSDNALFRVGSAFSRSSTRMQKVRDPEEEGTTSNKRAPTLKESTSYQTEISILQEPTLEEQAYEEKKQREEAGSLRKGLSCEKINESVSKIDVKNDLTSPLSQDSAVVPDYHPYDTPGITPYSIPSGTPAVLESSTVVDIIQDTSVYQIPSGLSVPQDSSVYQIPSGLSVAQDSSVYQIPSGVSYKEEGMTVTDGPTADNPDYIFMSTSPDDVLANEVHNYVNHITQPVHIICLCFLRNRMSMQNQRSTRTDFNTALWSTIPYYSRYV